MEVENRMTEPVPKISSGVKNALDVEITEDEIHLKGADGLDLKVSGRIPDKWALLLLIAIASMLGLNELGMGGL